MAIPSPWTPVPEKHIKGAIAWWETVNDETPCIEDQMFVLQKLAPGLEFTNRDGKLFSRKSYPELSE